MNPSDTLLTANGNRLKTSPAGYSRQIAVRVVSKAMPRKLAIPSKFNLTDSEQNGFPADNDLQVWSHATSDVFLLIVLWTNEGVFDLQALPLHRMTPGRSEVWRKCVCCMSLGSPGLSRQSLYAVLAWIFNNFTVDHSTSFPSLQYWREHGHDQTAAY